MAIVQKFQNVQDAPRAVACRPPAAARELQSLPRVDYEDAFSIEVPATTERDAQGWTRAVFDHSSPRVRALLGAVGLVTGAEPTAPRSSGRVAAFNVVQATPDAVCLETLTRMGLVQVVVLRQPPDRLVLATFIQFGGEPGRALFTLAVRRGHRRVVPFLIERAAARAWTA